MKPLAAGLALLVAAVAAYAGFANPTRAEAERTWGDYERLRREAGRGDDEVRRKAERNALWMKARLAAWDPQAPNPSLALRRRLLDSASRAGVPDVDLEVAPGRAPYAASARLSGEAPFAAVARLLEEVDPGASGLVVESARLAPATSEGDVSFVVEVQMPAAAVPRAGQNASAPSRAASTAKWDRDLFEFGPPPQMVTAPRPVVAPKPPTPAAEPAATPTPEPAVRLVGLVRRGSTLLAVLAAGGEVHVLAPGSAAQGFTVLSVDEDGVTVRNPQGAELVLTPRS